MKGLGDMMKKAQEMQENMQKAQRELATRFDLAFGHYFHDLEMLEDLIAAAVNDAVHKVEKENQSAMQDMTAGLNLPPGFKLPF